MGRRGNTFITIVIAICIAINIATVIVFNHRLNQIKSNIPYLLQGDDQKALYFHFGRNPMNKINSIYKTDVNGRLVKILSINEIHNHQLTLFYSKQNQIFYAKAGEKTILYKEG